MKIYLRILGALYFAFAIFHFINLFGVPEEFVQSGLIFKVWLVYLVVLELFACVGLWRQKTWGIYTYFVLVYTQLMAYCGFPDSFKYPTVMIAFHISTLLFYAFLAYRVVAKGLLRPQARKA